MKTTNSSAHANVALVLLGIFVTTALASDLIGYLTTGRFNIQIANVSVVILASLAGALLGKTISSRLTTGFAALLLGFIAIAPDMMPIGFSLVAAFLIALGASHPYLHTVRSPKKAAAFGVAIAITAFLLFVAYVCAVMTYRSFSG